MNRTATTDFLSELLIYRRLSKPGTYWAKEVCFDYGTTDVRRLDFLHFEPENTMSVAGLEHGKFTGYEIKSCKADFESGFGRNMEGDENYFVTTAEAWNSVKSDIFPEKYGIGMGVMVAVPAIYHPNSREVTEWILHPDKEPYENLDYWRLHKVYVSRPLQRKRSITELLFCMMRARCR